MQKVYKVKAIISFDGHRHQRTERIAADDVTKAINGMYSYMCYCYERDDIRVNIKEVTEA